MYIPLSIPSTQLPQYVQLDRHSQWHTSALFSTALESISLPTRLRHDAHKRGLICDLEAALNINGNQRIAKLQYSILDPEETPLLAAITHGSTDCRAPPGTNGVLAEEEKIKLAEQRFDIDLFNDNAPSTSPFATRHGLPDHAFGIVDNLRTKIATARAQGLDEDDITCARKRRRFAGLPVVEKYVIPNFVKSSATLENHFLRS